MLGKRKTEFLKRTFGSSGATWWNNLPQDFNKLAESVSSFKRQIQQIYDSLFVAGFRSQFLMPTFLLCLFAYYSSPVYIFVYFL